MPLNKSVLDKVSKQKIIVNMINVGRPTFSKISLDEMALGDMPVGKMTLNQMSYVNFALDKVYFEKNDC